VPGCEPASRQHQAGITFRDLKGNSCGDRRSTTGWSKHRVDPGEQITTRVTKARVAGRREVLIEADELDLEHDHAP
jgi:hypothetical protein